jgi:hypothetical protein
MSYLVHAATSAKRSFGNLNDRTRYMWPQHATTSTLHVLILSHDFYAITQHRLSSIALALLASQTSTHANMRKPSAFLRTLFSLAEFVKHAFVREYPLGMFPAVVFLKDRDLMAQALLSQTFPTFVFDPIIAVSIPGQKHLGKKSLPTALHASYGDLGCRSTRSILRETISLS